jgi:hypothetical protein
MARRKRPDRNRGRFELIRALFRSGGEFIACHPSVAGGVTVFGVTFAFVTINALVYQPGKHPAPFYETRTPASYGVRVPAIDEVPVPSSRVTTFRIEHSDPQSTASIPDKGVELQDRTVFSLQREMHARGLYRGDVDGVFGPQTANAIRAYEKSQGLAVTGEPTDALLVHLMISKLDAVAVPQARPGSAAPVARTKRPVESAPAPVGEPEVDLVLYIQKGLSNIAYGDVQVDGVIGKQTSDAIADFQRHYRLPVTGQPDRIVLQKLREIGAL